MEQVSNATVPDQRLSDGGRLLSSGWDVARGGSTSYGRGGVWYGTVPTCRAVAHILTSISRDWHDEAFKMHEVLTVP